MAPRRQFLVLVWLCAAVSTTLAQTVQPASASRAVLGRATGMATIDGTKTPVPTTIYDKQDVVTDPSLNLDVINRGNTLAFKPNTHFTGGVNNFRLLSGGSKVASYTGMTAHLPDCFSVTPVDPNYMTLYEVNWTDSSALVYARYQRVKIRYWLGGEPRDDDTTQRQPTREWIVDEGHMARIRDVHLCRPLIDFWPNPNLPTALELGATAAVVTTIPLWGTGGPSKQPISAEGP